MPRNILYPEGSEQLNVIVPEPVKRALRVAAQRHPRQSVSQLVSIILEDWLTRRGELSVREEVKA